MYNKHNIAVAKAASKTSIKPELGCISFYGNRTIATDSFRLLEVSAEGEAHEPKMFPAKEVDRLVKLKKDETISLERIEQITGMVPNPHWQYPDIDHVLKGAETNEDYVELTINGRYLAELVLTISKMSPFEAVKLRVPTSTGKPVLIYSHAVNKEKDKPMQTARGLVMPMNK